MMAFRSTRRHFRRWINTIFNQVDFQRIIDVGADRAASEWLLKCGASVKWICDDQWISDYNKLHKIVDDSCKIEEIDATDSCIMHVGFRYLEGLKCLKKIKFRRCIYLEDRCMHELKVVRHTLEHLEVISCGNISDEGVQAIVHLAQLKTLFLCDLPEVKNRERCISVLEQRLPECQIQFHVVSEVK